MLKSSGSHTLWPCSEPGPAQLSTLCTRYQSNITSVTNDPRSLIAAVPRTALEIVTFFPFGLSQMQTFGSANLPHYLNLNRTKAQ